MDIFVSYYFEKNGYTGFRNNVIDVDFPPQDFADICKIEGELANIEDSRITITNWKEFYK
jgi:hypothetical protein